MAGIKSIQSSKETNTGTMGPIDKSSAIASLPNDVREVIGLAYPIQSMLQGAQALLEDFGGDDSAGQVWAASNILDVVLEKVIEIYRIADQRDMVKTCEYVAGIDLSNVGGAA
jgi:hypothetical protein